MSVDPLGIWREILVRLPAESLLRFRAVCKGWCAVIDDPRFVKSHTENQLSSNTIIFRRPPLNYFNLEDLKFSNGPQKIPVTPVILPRTVLSCLKSFSLSACNGLMLCAPEYRDGQIHWESTGAWEIWNLLTFERLKLPDPNIDLRVVCAGIGYDCVADDYRVVVVDYNGESTRRTHLYSLKLDSWRIIGDCPFGIWSRDIQHGVFLSGALHWVSRDDQIIVAFEFATESYRHMALPSGLETTTESMQLEALAGCLFLSYIDNEDCKYTNHQRFHVWVMNDYGAEDSWIELFSFQEDCNVFSLGNSIRLVAYTKNENRLLIQYWKGFFWFDVETKSVKSVEIHGGFCRDSKIAAQICPRNLLRLHDSCGRVASRISTRNKGTRKKANTKLTFCIRDHEVKVPRNACSSHDDCYIIDSNLYASSCQGEKIQTSSSNPDSDSLVPLDICREIFLHLPAKSLIRFRAVCKAYRAFIDEPCFVRAHTNNQPLAKTILIKNSSGPPFYPLYSIDLDALNCRNGLQRIPSTPLSFPHSGLSHLPASVCNGLILIAYKKWEIWNPLTNECLQLRKGKFNLDIISTGLGYDDANDDYKIVVVDRCPRLEREDYVYQTHVYSLRSDTWRMIRNFPINNGWLDSIWPGVYLCGALHWTSSEMDEIIALDLRTENYSQLQWPPLRRRSCVVDDQKFLEVLGGCLVMIDFVIGNDGDDNYMDLWVMKEYGAENSWINVFSINDNYIRSRAIRPVAYMKGESQILLQDEKGLIRFNAENNCLQKLKIHGFSKRSYARAFSGSIFRLHDNCGVSGSGSFRTKRRRIAKRQRETSDIELYLDDMRIRRRWPRDDFLYID